MEKIILHHRSDHHAQNSGYGQLADYIDCIQIPSGGYQLPYKFAKYVSKQMSQKGGAYDSMSVIKDWELIKRLLFSVNRERVIHYLNGERDIYHAMNLTSLYSNTRVCATFHKPPEVLSASITNNARLKKLDGVIAVGHNQVDFLKNWLNTEQVRWIPHGVDSHFFHPDNIKKKSNKVLFVGQHLRDFEAFNYAVPKIYEKNNQVTFTVILRNDFSHLVKPHSSLKIYSGLTDEELRSHYQQATLLLLPLINGTACNSILEAMACGLPIVTTDLPGTRGYLTSKESVLIPEKDYMSLVDETLTLLDNPNKLTEMSTLVRNKSIDFDWAVVAKQVNDFYDDII